MKVETKPTPCENNRLADLANPLRNLLAILDLDGIFCMVDILAGFAVAYPDPALTAQKPGYLALGVFPA